MDKIIALIKKLNDESSGGQDLPESPGMVYDFNLETNGQNSRLFSGPVELVDGQEFHMATYPELLQAALDGLDGHLAALNYARAVLEKVLDENL